MIFQMSFFLAALYELTAGITYETLMIIFSSSATIQVLPQGVQGPQLQFYCLLSHGWKEVTFAQEAMHKASHLVAKTCFTCLDNKVLMPRYKRGIRVSDNKIMLNYISVTCCC